jgi:PQQ-dependent dehydrogenase (methanol/ethanol family)
VGPETSVAASNEPSVETVQGEHDRASKMGRNHWRWIGFGIIILALELSSVRSTVSQEATAAPQKQFKQLCEGCHGEGGAGGDRAPALINNRAMRARSELQIQRLIHSGTPGGMPAFLLPDDQLKRLAHWLRSLNVSAFDFQPAGDVPAGRRFFYGNGQCATCHMVQGSGNSNGPDLSEIGRKSTVQEIEAVLENPTSQMGIHTTPTCPSWAFCPDETWGVVDVRLGNGTTLRGFARNESNRSIQVQDFDGNLHLLVKADYDQITHEKTSFMPALKSTARERQDLVAYLSSLGSVISGPRDREESPITPEAVQAVDRPKSGDWPNYDGAPSGNRYSSLNQINRRNVGRLKLEWQYELPVKGLEMTPVVMDGVMYVTAPGIVCAIDARSGREIWCYARGNGAQGGLQGANQAAANPGAAGDSHEPNRGATVVGSRVLVATGDAHLVCLNRLTGGVMWDVEMPESGGNGKYSSTAAPLIVGDLVVAGIAGGDAPLRGFLAAYKITTGQLAWRFWTIPKPGEPGSETWTGDALATGGGATWVTGSLDPDSDTVYWAVGNPFPATDGDERKGANLYTNCVIALEAKTGKLRWYYQFTPHDLHDWDATEPFVLTDITYKGRPRKLLMQANRNGFFYILDRTNGELLLAKPFVEKMNWASGIGTDGRPITLAANFPTKAGVKTCPAVRGATNWYSTAFSPETHLFYVMAVEDCSIYKHAGRGGYEGYRNPLDSGKRYLRALDIDTGKRIWEAPQLGAQEANYAGVLASAGGLVFYGETGGSFAAADSKTGALLWSFMANEAWKASPMTYAVNGHQYIAVASGGNILSFALPAADYN